MLHHSVDAKLSCVDIGFTADPENKKDTQSLLHAQLSRLQHTLYFVVGVRLGRETAILVRDTAGQETARRVTF